MKLYKLILVLIVIGLLYSCEDQLDLQPAQSIDGGLAIASESNIENILIGVYEEAGQNDSHGGRVQLMADLLGSGSATTWGGTFIEPRQLKNKSILADNAFVANYWDNSYEVINQANLVINNIDIITSDADKKNSVEGQARFLRALTYFDLVRHFSSGSMGIPVRTEGILDYAVDLSIARSDVTSVYALVIADLQSAISLLPDDNDFFADKYAAEALLARVYLQQGNFAGARDAAHSVIEGSGHSLNASFSAAFNNDANTPEDIFSFQVTSQTGDNDLVLFYADEGNGGRGGDVPVTDAYVALFDDPNDERANFFYESAQSGERLTAKYTNEFGNIPLIRLAEMYLIRAEGNFEEGTVIGDTPLNDLNTVRSRSTQTLLMGNVDKATILNERILELAFEGFSIHDVVRTQGSVDGFAYDAPELVLPIPQSEMDTNPSMMQNPGY